MATADDAVNVRRRGGRLDIARLKARLEKHIEIDPESGCWNWQGCIKNTGYGVMAIRIPGYRHPRSFLVHRVAFELWKGLLRRGLVVAHSCDNRRCCNPEHLRPTTQRQNCKDCAAKGRNPSQRYRYKCEDDLIRPLLEQHLLPEGFSHERTTETAAA